MVHPTPFTCHEGTRKKNYVNNHEYPKFTTNYLETTFSWSTRKQLFSVHNKSRYQEPLTRHRYVHKKKIPNGNLNPALATSKGIDLGSFLITSCLGAQTLPAGHKIRNIDLQCTIKNRENTHKE